jgi:ATP-dependent Lhr-like helicase
MHRAAARPSFRAVSLDHLPLFLALHQGLGTTNASLDDLKPALEGLFGWPVNAGMLETELLPARLDPYLPSWLDALMSETDLGWFGCGPQTLALGLSGDRHLFVEASAQTEEDGASALDTVFPHPFGRFSFIDLARHASSDSAQLAETLWNHAWLGEVATDTFNPVRQAVLTDFKIQTLDNARTTRGHRRRPRFDRWQSDRPMAGLWTRLPPVAAAADALEQEEDDRERARVLLERYGVLFRELLQRETPALRWARVFRSLRMLELAGEVVAGRFFEGVPGIQFMSHSAFRTLEGGLAEDHVWWANATDPASPCGFGFEEFKETLPRRVAGNHVVFRGRSIVVVSERRGNRLEIRVGADHPNILDYFGFFKNLLGRTVKPLKAITIETINGQPAAASEYRKPLSEIFHVTRTHNGLRLTRQY